MVVGYTRSMRLLLYLALLCTTLLTYSARAEELPAVGSYSDDARAARISELKIKYRIILTDDERVRIIERCAVAKSSLQKLSERVTISTNKRSEVYDNVIANLTSLRALVATKQIDASSLELLIVDYQQAAADFDVAATSYQTAIDDAIVLNCSVDPEGFRASIEGVREGRKKTSEAANEVVELTSSNLKTAFDTLKLRLTSAGVTNGD